MWITLAETVFCVSELIRALHWDHNEVLQVSEFLSVTWPLDMLVEHPRGLNTNLRDRCRFHWQGIIIRVRVIRSLRTYCIPGIGSRAFHEFIHIISVERMQDHMGLSVPGCSQVMRLKTSAGTVNGHSFWSAKSGRCEGKGLVLFPFLSPVLDQGWAKGRL